MKAKPPHICSQPGARIETTTSANLTYNSATGVLAYDVDGAGTAAPMTFAILGLVGHPALLGNDFLIVG